MLTLALLVVVAALVGGVPGTRQFVWQAADCELQVIMQVVTAEFCARRIFSACATPAEAAMMHPAANASVANRRMTVSRLFESAGS